MHQTGGGPLRAALLCFFAFLLVACHRFPPPDRANARPSHQLDVPFVSQEKYQCGPAALAMMLGWAGKPASAAALVSEVWLPERQGSLGIELLAASRSRGLLPYPVESADALFQEIQAGRPVLVMQNLALPALPQWHFAVVTGYRDGGDQIQLHSGTRENTTSHWNRFIRTWARADQWGFTMIRPGEVPASGTPDGLFRALTALADNLDYWPALLQRFPESGKLWFGYGNALWGAGEKARALTAFTNATRHSPEFASAWNNLAYALQERGEKTDSQQAICRAVSLHPKSAEIAASARELLPQSDCSVVEDCCARIFSR